MLARLRIGPKLLLAPGAVLLLLVVLSCAAYYAMLRQNASLETIVGQRAASMRAASSLAAQSQKAHADIYRLLSWMGGSFPVARTEPLRQDILAQHKRIAAGLDALAQATASAAEDRHVEQAAVAHRRYARAVREVIEMAPLDGSIGANAMLKAEGAFSLVAQRLNDLAALEESLSRDASSSAKSDFRMISVLMPAVLLLAIGLSLAITFAVRRYLLDEIRGITSAASDLASGDLTVRERDYGGDEIADSSRLLDASIRNLNGTLRTIVEAARQIGAASRDIKLGSLSLGSRAVYRAGSLAGAAGSMQVLSATVSLTEGDARAANRLAVSAADVAHQGGDVVERLVATLESGKRSAQRVADIVDQLDAVASETGTLALNAALDASRARTEADDGAGIAAVAAEVRALARRVAASAREIRTLVAQSVAEMDGGAAWAVQAGSSMERIASSVREVEDIVSRIGSTSQGQASNLQEVSGAIVRMDQVTRQNCTLVEEAANAARTLQMQALTLSRTMAGFRLEEGTPQLQPMRRSGDDKGTVDDAARERQPTRERRRHPASHLRLASSRK
ncbi:methyl-accepting chemotaxis protein [Massilia sp.]|uniref:methyl-accepting chemotaxis protein n=1 Tax=Massilia sp. TaxID=1882437 RepID=UPI00289EC3D1|nr:methyl-accepting chemotaxis protein [Massilia sp.]